LAIFISNKHVYEKNLIDTKYIALGLLSSEQRISINLTFRVRIMRTIFVRMVIEPSRKAAFTQQMKAALRINLDF
jgi:hypothetical protein